MPEINLLPTDLAPKPSVVKASGVIHKLTTIGVILFIACLGISIGLYLVFSSQLKDSTLRKAELESSIKALQATEQRLVLIKDRLSLIKEVMGREAATDEVEAVTGLINALPEGASLNQAKLTKDSTSVALGAQDSLALTQMLSLLISSGTYQQVDLISIGFTPSAGFSADFKLTK
jgi:Tfp pilus assembly protein PilN